MKIPVNLVIRGAEVLTPRGIERADVAVERGKVVRVGGVGETGAARVVDGTGKVVFPGAVDPHVHMELLTVSGKVSSDDFASGSRAAQGSRILNSGDSMEAPPRGSPFGPPPRWAGRGR